MKNILTVSVILAISAISFPAPAAQAGDDEAIAAIGGFVVGMIAGSLADDNHYSRHSYERSSRYDRHDRYDHHYSHRSSYRDDRHDRSSYKSGRWETRRFKKWVPGYWEVSYSSCGDRIKIWREGYYRWETKRVWVDFCSTDYRHRR